jgi:AraC-like DNA-binding protein
MIKYQTYKPHSALAQFVRFFWSLEADVKRMNQPFVHRALPDNCIELIFYCEGKLAISSLAGDEGNTFDSGVYGQTENFRKFKTENNFHLFGVYLYPYAVKLLFNLPASELLNVKVDSNSLLGIDGRMLEEQIILASSNEKRVELVSNFFLDRIRKISSYDGVFAGNIKSVVDHCRLVSTETFANHCNLSRRQFERKFKEYSGFSPKDFFSIVRFNNALNQVGDYQKSLAQIAIDNGYYDQSHFTNEFKKFSGYSPREFRMNYFKAVDARAAADFK